MAETRAYYDSYDGAPLAYRVLGAGTRPPRAGGRPVLPLVALAGGPGRDAAYLGDLGGLSEDRPLVIPDLRGTGESRGSAVGSDPGAYAFPRLARDLEALREDLDLDRMALFGHSAAATLAQAYAAEFPGRVSHLVLVAPGTRLQGRATRDAEEIFRSRSGEPWYEDAAAAIAALSHARDLTEARALLLRAAPGTYGTWGPRQREHAESEAGQLNPVPRAAFWQGVDEVARLDLLERLDDVRAPVLVLTGALDGLGGTEAGSVVSRCFRDSRHLALDGCGHYPWVDHPDLFRRALNTFLDQYPEPDQD